MKKLMTVLLALMIGLAFSVSSFAAEHEMTHEGVISTVDANAKTVKVKTDKEELTIHMTDKSHITAGKENKTLADVKVGDKVTCKIILDTMDGKYICLGLNIKGLGKK